MPSQRPFRYLKDPVFLTGSALFVLSQLVLKPLFGKGHPFISGHLGDLWLIPCAIPVLLYAQRRLRLRVDDHIPRWSEVGLYLAIWSAMFEWLLPELLRRGTADPWDVLIYAAGGLLAQIAWRLIY